MSARPPACLPEPGAFRVLFSHRAYLVAYPPSVVLVAVGYLLLLAWVATGVFGFWGVPFLPPASVGLAIGFGILFPLLLLLDVYLWKHPHCVISDRGRHTEGTTIGAVVLGILPNLLCCTPIVPTLLAVFVSGTTLISISAPVQHAMSVYETLFYAVSLVLLGIAIHLAARRMDLGVAQDESLPEPDG